MTEADFHVRFKKLERSNRRLTAFCFSFAVVLIVALVQGQVKPPGGATPKALVVDSVRTKSVFIVDDKGEDVGFWGRLGLSHFDNDSSVSMTSHSLYQTYKDKNMWGISSKAQHPGGMVMVMNADGLPQAGLSAINYEPRLAIFDKNENLRAVLDAHTLPVPGTGKVIKYPEAAVTLLAPGDKVTWEAKPGGGAESKEVGGG